MKVKAFFLLLMFAVMLAGCAPRPSKDLALLKGSLDIKFNKFPSISGIIKNQGKGDIQLRSIAFTIWKDENREYIKDAGIEWFAKILHPDQTATFEVKFPDMKQDKDISFYSYEIRWYDARSNRLYRSVEDS